MVAVARATQTVRQVIAVLSHENEGRREMNGFVRVRAPDGKTPKRPHLELP